MFKKLLVVAALVIAFVMPMNAVAEEGGVISSYKNVISVNWIEVDGENLYWVFFGDSDRAQQRANYYMKKGHPIQEVVGFRNEDGSYRIMVSFGFFHMPMGDLSWEAVTDIIKNFKILGDLRPLLFQTFLGFEDVWVYVDFDEDGWLEKVKSIVNELYQEEFKRLEGEQR